MIVAVTGTGTGVGKTTVSVALARALRGLVRVHAFKPIETGGDADGRALTEATGFDAGPGMLLTTPVAPNVAARLEGARLDLASLARETERRASACDVLLLETAGGLFSPMSDDQTNADWLELVAPARIVVVASNRLGVLHDVEATRRASSRPIDLVVLTGGSAADPSVAGNRTELERRLRVVAMRDLQDVGELARWAAELASATSGRR